MNARRQTIVLLLILTATLPASAGIFFNRKPRSNPGDRVPMLIYTLKADQDERKRASAAEELRDYDPNAYPEITAVLIDALQHDPKSSVRSEAVQSLSKLRPISPDVGRALEEASEHDASIRVRWQAKSSLVQYHLGGYHSPKREETMNAPAGVVHSKTGEPPLADPAGDSLGSPLEVNPSAPVLPPATSSRRGSPEIRYSPQPQLMPVPSSRTTPPPFKTPDNGPDLPPPE